MSNSANPPGDEVITAIITHYLAIGVPTDNLPYSPEFEDLYKNVLTSTGVSLPRSDCWRLLARARKRGLLPRLCR